MPQDVLQYQIEPLSLGSYIVEGDNVGVGETGYQPGFTEEACTSSFAGKALGTQEFNRHIPVKHLVVGSVDNPCTALPEILCEAIAVLEPQWGATLTHCLALLSG